MEKLPILKLAFVGFICFLVSYIPTFIPGIGAGSMTLFSKAFMGLAILFIIPLVYAILRSVAKQFVSLVKRIL